jgi:hypothetical protein
MDATATPGNDVYNPATAHMMNRLAEQHPANDKFRQAAFAHRVENDMNIRINH